MTFCNAANAANSRGNEWVITPIIPARVVVGHLRRDGIKVVISGLNPAPLIQTEAWLLTLPDPNARWKSTKLW